MPTRCRSVLSILMFAFIAIAVAATAALGTACYGPAPSDEQCEKACLHRATLFHDQKWAARLQAASASERAQLEVEKAADFKHAMGELGLQACVSHCARPGNKNRVECIIKATTLAEADACKD